MKILPIRILGDPILRTATDPIKKVSTELEDLAQAMIETMFNARGLGLAAPQVGELKRLFVLNTKVLDPQDGRLARVLINPKIVYLEGEVEDEEGCLSIPGLFYPLKRPQKAVIEALELTEKGLKAVEIEAEDLVARAILHENDHLDGVLFIDRLDVFTRASLVAEWEKNRQIKTG